MSGNETSTVNWSSHVNMFVIAEMSFSDTWLRLAVLWWWGMVHLKTKMSCLQDKTSTLQFESGSN